jgi:hypothetical protein
MPFNQIETNWRTFIVLKIELSTNIFFTESKDWPFIESKQRHLLKIKK